MVITRTSCVLICLYSVNSLCKDVISISIDNDRQHKDSIDGSDEKNNIKIEIKNSKNESHENIIPISSSSGSLEHYDRIELQIQPMLNSKDKERKSEETDNENMYFGKLLSSYEETRNLWGELKSENIYRDKMLTQTQVGNDERRKNRRIVSQTGNDQNRKNMRIESHVDNSYHKEIPSSYNNGKKHEKLHSDNKHHNNIKTEPQDDNKYHEKNPISYGNAENERVELQRDNNNIYRDEIQAKGCKSYHKKYSNPCGNERDKSQDDNIIIEKVRTEPQGDNSYHHEKKPTSYENSGNQFVKPDSDINYHNIMPSSDKKENKRVVPQSDEILISPYDNKYREKDPTSYGNDAKRVKPQRDIYREAEPHGDSSYHMHSTPRRHRTMQIEDDTKINFPDNALTMRKEPKSEKIHHKKILSEQEEQSENNKESMAIAIAPRNSTIEGSDREYQGNIATQETDDEDESTLVDYPYSVSVQRKGAHYASGALVGARWVLSTAAEFYNVRETIKLFTMRLGSVDCKKGGIVTPIKNIVIHPNFNPGQPSFDISILRMAESVPLSSVVKPIGLSRVAGKVMSAKFLTTYWPRIVVKQGVVPPSAKERVKYNSMRVSTQKLIPSDQCIRLMAAVNVTVDRTSLCLKPVKVHHSVCSPDIGAPVVAVDGLWGITSGWVSPLCPSEPLPTVFTRVSIPGLRSWIDGQMRL